VAYEIDYVLLSDWYATDVPVVIDLWINANIICVGMNSYQSRGYI